MPWGLKRFQQTRNLHFITFSCYHRAPLLGTPEARRVFEQTLEKVRQWYALYVTGYVVMPEHVHLLISEPERGNLAIVIKRSNRLLPLRWRRLPMVSCWAGTSASMVGARAGSWGSLVKCHGIR